MIQSIHPLLRWSETDQRWEFTLSANSRGIYSRCRTAYRNYKVLGRRAYLVGPWAINGDAMHRGLEAMNAGLPIPEQESAIEAAYTERPTPADDYRQPTYTKDGLAAFRAELGPIFKDWTIEEAERDVILPLGEVLLMNPPSLAYRKVTVLWEVRRDLVGVAPDGYRWLVDYKTSSRDEEADYKSLTNSGAFMGGIWSWLQEHPDKPVAGAQPIRLIMRKPSKTGVAFSLPRDKPIFFQPERVEEWRRHVLRDARDILERDPADPDDWPQSATPVGCCRTQWFLCDFLENCCLPPDQRLAHLMTDAFEDARAEREKKRVAVAREKNQP